MTDQRSNDTELVARIHNSAAEIAPALWNQLSPNTLEKPDNPFHIHGFWKALEDSQSAVAETGWLPQHITIERDGETVGLMPLFLKSHSQGEYVFDHGWANAFEQAGGRYYPKLQSSVPFTPATAEKLLVPSGEDAIKRALLSASEQLCAKLNASSIHATFVPQEEQDLASDMGWLARTDTQFHWYNRGYETFDEFLQTLSSRKRKTIRRERREALKDGLRIEWITGSDLTETVWDAFFQFYMDTGSRKWGRPYLTRPFFSMISETMADHIVLMFAYDGTEPIAGALNFLGKQTIYGRNWGCTRDVPFLHFELCYYQAIDFAIQHKLKTVEAGAQGEHKLARGYVPSLTRSAHWIAHPGLRDAVANYLDNERLAVLRDQEMLGQYTPFRKGERQDKD